MHTLLPHQMRIFFSKLLWQGDLSRQILYHFFSVRHPTPHTWWVPFYFQCSRNTKAGSRVIIMESLVPSLCVIDQPPVGKYCKRSLLFMDASIAQSQPHPKEVFQESLLDPRLMCTGSPTNVTFRQSYQHASRVLFFFFLFYPSHLQVLSFLWVHLRGLWALCACSWCGPDEGAVVSDTAAAGIRELEC